MPRERLLVRAVSQIEARMPRLHAAFTKLLTGAGYTSAFAEEIRIKSGDSTESEPRYHFGQAVAISTQVLWPVRLPTGQPGRSR